MVASSVNMKMYKLANQHIANIKKIKLPHTGDQFDLEQHLPVLMQ